MDCDRLHSPSGLRPFPASLNRRQQRDADPLMAVRLQVTRARLLSYRQPDGGLLGGEDRARVIVSRMPTLLRETEHVREILRRVRQPALLPLEFSLGPAVVEAPVHAGPGLFGYGVVGRPDQDIGVAGREGVEQGVVGIATASPNARYPAFGSPIQ